MKIKNTSSFSTELLREIIDFCRPPRIGNFTIILKDIPRTSYKLFGGWAHWYCNKITMGINSKIKYPYFCKRNKRVVHGIKVVDGVRTSYKSYRGGGYLDFEAYTKNELLVHLVAHELRHLWQYKVPRGHRVWGAKGRFSERDADAYAIHKVREWRRRDEWKRSTM